MNAKKMVLVVSGDSRDGSIGIQQDADMYISRLSAGDDLEFDLRSGRGIWIQVIHGELSINGQTLSTGDALCAEDLDHLKIVASEKSELIIFDLA